MEPRGWSRADSMGLSIITVCMNRGAHLRRTAPLVAALAWHDEHMIVDWSSSPPLRRQDLPADPRLRLLRVEGEPRWSLCRAYNFAFTQAYGDRILKLDADCWPTDLFLPDAPELRVPSGGGAAAGALLCAFASGKDGLNGQFLIDRSLFLAVGGFNEFLVGYGFDDKDLRSRLRLHLGNPFALLPHAWLGVIPHTDAERAELPRATALPWLRCSQGLATMRASRQGNRLLAAHCPWSARSPHSSYLQESNGAWRVVPASLPLPPAEVATEIDHDRRMTFWSYFLGIPEVFLERLPYPLFPPSHAGRWDVRWWHRLWWYSGRLLLQAPVLLLIFLRELLVSLRPAGSRPGAWP